MMISVLLLFFVFKQKTAYEMRISDWSSDVCSSDLPDRPGNGAADRTRPDRSLEANLKTDSIVALSEHGDIHDYVRSLWSDGPIKQSHDGGGDRKSVV